MVLMTFSMVSLHFLHQKTTWLFCHVIPLAQPLPSCDFNSIVNGTIDFLKSRCSEWSATWFFVIWSHWHQHQHDMTLMPFQWHHYIPYVQTTEVRCNMTCLVMLCQEASAIINGIIAFIMSRWSKWGATWHFGHNMPLPAISHAILSMACDTDANTSTGIKSYITSKQSSTWQMWRCHWSHHQHDVKWNLLLPCSCQR